MSQKPDSFSPSPATTIPVVAVDAASLASHGRGSDRLPDAARLLATVPAQVAALEHGRLRELVVRGNVRAHA